jgi:hypothetical protein
MKCKVKRSRKTGEITQVKARNDQPSQLFTTLEKVYNNSESAAKQYATTYLSKFAEKVNPSGNTLLGVVLMDANLNATDYSTITKIRKLDKHYNEVSS